MTVSPVNQAERELQRERKARIEAQTQGRGLQVSSQDVERVRPSVWFMGG